MRYTIDANRMAWAVHEQQRVLHCKEYSPQFLGYCPIPTALTLASLTEKFRPASFGGRTAQPWDAEAENEQTTLESIGAYSDLALALELSSWALCAESRLRVIRNHESGGAKIVEMVPDDSPSPRDRIASLVLHRGRYGVGWVASARVYDAVHLEAAHLAPVLERLR